MKKEDDYAYGLDALRFLAAVLVAIFHFTNKNDEASWTLPFGWIGVQIFFVISGVVIAKSASNATSQGFLIGRFLRLYPAAWIAAVISTSILLLVPLTAYSTRGIVVNSTFEALVQSLGLLRGPFLASAYWTLPIELSFYALVCLSILSRGRLTLLGIARGLILISLPYLAASTANAIGWVQWPWLDLGFGIKNALLVRHGPFFAIGIYVWALSANCLPGRLDRALLVLAVMLGAVEISLLGSDAFNGETIASTGALIAASLATFMLAVGCVYFAMRSRSSTNLRPGIKHALKSAGLMTYPFYLLHEILGGAVLHCLDVLMVQFPLRLGAALFVAGVMSYLVCTYAEPVARQQLKRVIAALKSMHEVWSVGRARSISRSDRTRSHHQDEDENSAA